MADVGERVMAQWSNGGWYPGKIAKTRQNGGRSEYFIRFDDGDEAWVGPDELAAAGHSGAGIQLGAKVLGDWTEDNWYPGTVTEANSNGTMFFVQFDDGDTKWLPPQKIRVVGGIAGAGGAVGGAPALHINPGMRVSAEWTHGAWYDGTIAKVNPEHTRFFVQYDDGDTKWCTSNELRPMPGQNVQPYASAPQAPTNTTAAPVGATTVTAGPATPPWSQPQAQAQQFVQSAQAPQHVVEKVIERQVLVVRCSYCNGLTPADVSTCQSCGAKTK